MNKISKRTLNSPSPNFVGSPMIESQSSAINNSNTFNQLSDDGETLTPVLVAE